MLLGAHSLTEPEPHKRLYNVRAQIAHPGSNIHNNRDDLLLLQVGSPTPLPTAPTAPTHPPSPLGPPSAPFASHGASHRELSRNASIHPHNADPHPHNADPQLRPGGCRRGPSSAPHPPSP